MRKLQEDQSEDKIRLFRDLLDITRQQHGALQEDEDEKALADYLHWSTRFAECAQRIDELNPMRQTSNEIRPLMEEIQRVQQQTEQIMNSRFSSLISDLKATRQAKTAVTGYYGGSHHSVSLYFDEKQ